MRTTRLDYATWTRQFAWLPKTIYEKEGERWIVYTVWLCFYWERYINPVVEELSLFSHKIRYRGVEYSITKPANGGEDE